MRRTPFALLAIFALALLVAGPARAEDEAAPDLTTVEGVVKALRAESAEVRIAAVKAAHDMQDEHLLQPLIRLLQDKEVTIRDAAIDALVARTEAKERKTAAKSIAATLLKPLGREPSESEREREALVVPALHDLAQEVTIKDLLDDVHPEAPADLVKARLRAVANVPSKAAIEALIDYGARRRAGDGHRAAVREALRYATGQTFGGDPDTWRQWWRENEKDFDCEAAARARAESQEAKEDRERRREERKEKPRKGGKRDGEKPDGTGS